MSPESTASPQPTPARKRRKTEIGVVTSDKMNKTRRVVVERLVPHPKYGKLMRRRTVCHAHDEANESHHGDLVEIMETRPLSKLKRWRIVRIVRKGAQQALAGEDEAAPPTT
jgi:small subunit ribosomal protein S17